MKHIWQLNKSDPENWIIRCKRRGCKVIKPTDPKEIAAPCKEKIKNVR